jgi:hypothetical protein
MMVMGTLYSEADSFPIAAEEGEEEQPILLTDEMVSSPAVLKDLEKTMDGKSVAMTKVDLPSMKLGDITVLSKLTHIRHVNVMDNLIKDLSPLFGLDHMLSLNASKNKVETVDMPTMPFLQLVDLSGNAIKGSFACPELPNLRHLLLGENEVEGITGLEANTQLQRLELHNNKLTSCEGLGNASVVKITLNDNEIADVKGLSTLSLVKSLDLSGNSITGLEGLPTSGALSTLMLARNQVGTLEDHVKGHVPESVTNLDMSENPIMEGLDRVQVLVALRGLKMLNAAEVTPEETAAADLILNPPPAEEEEAPAA